MEGVKFKSEKIYIFFHIKTKSPYMETDLSKMGKGYWNMFVFVIDIPWTISVPGEHGCCVF